MTLWNPGDSDALDREIKALRRLDRRFAPVRTSHRRSAPTPKLQPNGRWLAKFVHNKQHHQGTFDTWREAERFIDETRGQ